MKVKKVTKGLKTQLSVHGTCITDVEDKIENLERERRKTTLIIDGVEESTTEDTTEIVERIFKDIGVTYNTRVRTNVYRRGKPSTGRKHATDSDARVSKQRPQPIVVVFLRQSEKGDLFRNLKNLKEKEILEQCVF